MCHHNMSLFASIVVEETYVPIFVCGDRERECGMGHYFGNKADSTSIL